MTKKEGTTRREILSLAGLAGKALMFYGGYKALEGAGVVAFIPSEPPDPAEAYRMSVETNLGIRLVTLKEWYEAKRYNVRNYKTPPHLQWDFPRITLIGSLLPHLPGHFYKPEFLDRVYYLLDDLEITAGTRSSRAIYEKKLEYSEVRLDFRWFEREHVEDALETLAHEGVHRAMRSLIGKPDPNIDRIIGGEFATRRLSLLSSIREREKDLSQDFRYRFVGPLSTGLGRSKTPEEFIAQLGQSFYIYGRNTFSQLSLLLPNTMVDSLYAYMKNEVFRGKEYPSFPQVNLPI